jgi:hypothetical protein
MPQNQIMPEDATAKSQPEPGDFPDDNVAKAKTWPLYSPDGAQSVIVDANSDLSAYEGWTKKKSA